MMNHLHGSTAICGLVKYSGESFPAEYRGDFYSGNVMTSRINRNKPEYHGSTIKAIEQPDFLTTTDPWVRPVDIHVGPDGAMYILDFYNRIIGHYEVPLPHPGRDRTSGRIWRVAFKGDDPKTKPAKMPPDLTELGVPEVIAQLDHPQLEHRLRVQNWLTDNTGQAAADELRQTWQRSQSVRQKGHILWALERLQPLDFHAELSNNASEDSILRVHVVKAVGARNDWVGGGYGDVLQLQVNNRNSFVKRAAAEACAAHPDSKHVPLHILKKLFLWESSTNRGDDLLQYALRMAVRNYLASVPDLMPIYEHELLQGEEGQGVIAPVFLSIGSTKSAEFLIHYLENYELPRDKLLPYLQHAARYVPLDRVASFVKITREKFTDDIGLQASILQSVHSGLAQRGQNADTTLAVWGQELAAQLLESGDGDRIAWTAVPIDNLLPSENPWVIAPRPSRDGDKTSLFYYSLPKGEQRTGVYRSGTFAIPEKLSFWCAGHSGQPREPLNNGNYIRLRDATTHAILAESRPPRDDTARQFTWNLSDHVGKQGYVELIDGDTGNAYAWLAVGRFSLDALNPGQEAGRQQLAAEIVGKLKLASFRPQLATFLASPETESTARTAIAQALVALDPAARAAALAAALADPSLPAELRPRIGYAITVKSDSEYLDNLRTVMQRVPTRLQTTLADTLAGDAPGAALLLTLIESGHATPRLLLAPALKNKLTALSDARLNARATDITAKLPPADAILDTLIIERRRAFARAATSSERGQAVYIKHCAACHKIADKGALVGPQLDGIGNRGLDRLLEDVLDPNRNVDVAFRTTTLRLIDGRVLSGLIRREEGNQIILADPQGKEFSIPKADIDEQQKTSLSLMPANVGEITTPDEFADLMAYLLNQRASPNN
jgi:putative heme-binding domain-containing protein